MKKSKFMNLPGIIFLAMLIAIVSSCKQPDSNGGSSGSKIVADSLVMPEGLIEITDTAEAQGYLRTYRDSSTERNFGQGMPYEVGDYLVRKFNKEIILSLAKKDTNVFSIFVIPFDSAGTYSYKYFTDGKNIDSTYNMLYLPIPVCRPGNCPCKYYPPPCN